MAKRIGQQFGNYRLVSLLGEGGFADVYLGEHSHINTQAAIKVLHIQLTSEGIEQFRSEARTIARLEHPHIVRVLDFGVEDGIPFLVMSYAPNGTLRQRHPKGTQVPLSSVVSYVKQAASALQYAHEQRVIHRDVKPENLLVDRNHEILLSDFGLALVTQTSLSQHTQDLAGTVAYMAPEQIEGHPRPGSDQYSLGILIYEWLSGEQPFGGSFAEIAVQHSITIPPPLREKVPSLPAVVEQVVFTALAKDPKQRFATIRAFAIALEQASQITEQSPLPASSSVISPSPVEVRTLLGSMTAPTSLMTPSDPPLSKREVTTAPDPMASSSGEVQTLNPTPALATSIEQAKLTPYPAQPARTGLSRRAVLLGLAGLVGVSAAGSGLVWLLRSQAPQTSPSPSSTVPTTSAILHPTDHTAFGFDPQHTHFNPVERTLSVTNVSHLIPYWTALTGAAITSSPAVANGIVYIGSDDHKLYAFDVATGKQRWTAPTGERVYSSPAVAKGIVYVGSGDGNLYAFDAAIGGQRWKAPTGNQIYSSPIVVDGIVYIGSFDTKLYAFDAATGNLLWSASTDSYIISSPAVANKVIYIGSGGGKLYAFNATAGTPLWSTQIGDRIASSPAVANGIVYVGSADMKLYALGATTGNILWTASTGDALYSSPAVANGVVYVGSNDHKLYAFTAATGKLLWSTPTYSYIWSSPAVANGVVYSGSWDGNLYALNAFTGRVLWIGRATDHFFSSPAVVNGVVYIGSWDSKLYAFHLPSAKP